MNNFSFERLKAIVIKEFIQMRRDRLTFGMMVGIPMLQLVIFGFAINTNPKHLPTAVFAGDNGPFVRSFIYALHNSEYFSIVREAKTEKETDRMISLGQVQFVVHVPENFSRDLVRGQRPTILIEADATDPLATANAISAAKGLADIPWDRDLNGALADLRSKPGPVDIQVHAKYNPEAISQYYIVPGLMGVALTLTMVVITALAVTRERERGTMETLLSTPAKPIEVMIGKITPYILVGYIQATLILVVAKLFFGVPMPPSVVILFVASFFFIVANLAVGILFSTVAKNQLQAVQMAVFFFLPSILMSGFMFPFRGMPEWAQVVGQVLPLTHFLKIVRGILLKGHGLFECLYYIWPILIFIIVVLTISVKRYQRTLD